MGRSGGEEDSDAAIGIGVLCQTCSRRRVALSSLLSFTCTRCVQDLSCPRLSHVRLFFFSLVCVCLTVCLGSLLSVDVSRLCVYHGVLAPCLLICLRSESIAVLGWLCFCRCVWVLNLSLYLIFVSVDVSLDARVC